jgi:hypothetical protein
MLLHVRDGIRGTIIDCETGRRVPKPIWLDTETGTCEFYQVDAAGRIKTDAAGNYLTTLARGRFKFIPRAPTVPAVTPAPPVSPPPAMRAETRRRLRTSPLNTPLLCQRCDHYACDRVAEWQTSDEVTLPPQVAGGRRYERGKVIEVRFWCDFHFEAPRLMDHTGREVVKVFEDAGGCRPQWHSR